MPSVLRSPLAYTMTAERSVHQAIRTGLFVSKLRRTYRRLRAGGTTIEYSVQLGDSLDCLDANL